jgi:TonB-linked SusC/RagA family outer membrane protein
MKRVLLGIALLCLGSAVALAQRNLSGRVTDEQGEGLVGVTVLAVGTSSGASTDINGAYRLTVPSDAKTLKFTYTGYETQEVEIGASDVIDLSMTTSANTLQDIVVVGYGTQQKRAITGSISTVRGEDLAELPAQSFDQLLQGRAAGVNVNLPNGVLNNPPVFRIRGINSINLSSFPLIVIDGVPTYTGDFGGGNANLVNINAANNPLSNLNPNDIESIDILKDASATAIYGSRAAAGVVLITTKRGKSGRTRVNYDAWAGWSEATRVPEVLNAQQYVEIKNEGAANAGLTGPQFFLDSLNGQLIDTRWADYIYRTGTAHNHNLSFSGGTDQTTYYLSLGYTNQEGMIRNNDFERLSGRLNLDHKIGILRLGGTLGYAENNNAAPNTGSLPGGAFATSGMGRLAFVLAPIVGPYNADGSYNITSNNLLGPGKNKQSIGFANPVPVLDLNRSQSQAGQLQANIYGQIEVLQGLRLKTQYGIDNFDVENTAFWSPVHGDGFGTNGMAQNNIIRQSRWNWQNILSYDREYNDLHTVGVTLGNEQQYTETDGWGAQRTAIADPFFTTFQGNFSTINPSGTFQGKNYLLSFFGRLTYAFDRRYYVTLNARQDEYSAFAEGAKKGTFWGASAGWTLSEESFWENSIGNAINFFKIRGSYGTVGNNLGIGDFASMSLYNSALYGPNATISFAQAGNPALSWETSKKTDVGVVFGLFNDRLQGEYTYFVNLIDGLVLNAPQAPSRGIPNNSIAVNIGSMENIGHEIGLGATVLTLGDFSWQTNANITLMRNEVLSLAEGNNDIFGSTSTLETANILRVGESIGSLYAVPTQGVNPATGQRVFVKADGTLVQYNHAAPAGQRWTTLDGTVTSAATVSADGRVYGPVLPTWFGGWTNTFRYAGFDLEVQMNYAGGNYVYNGSKAGLRDQRFWNNHTDVLNRWTENNTSGTIPRVVFGDNISNGSAFPISENIEKGDFLRVRNVTLGYRLPQGLLNRWRMSNLRIYGNINNALLFTDYSGTDPEVSANGNSNLAPGVDRNTVPMARTYSVGLNVGF